uniref:RNA helicase n=1 Tax=Picocystis salinarum TaxID=88271 RepID=A0A7S3XG40_9CHLO|mmetsp:Transcript_5759/g.35786  ORF Transcript_5759/g.35786 Transcript_5759/m.35786 type:complete len:865 (+) Transcript_5759:397-2991(+)
MDPRRREETPSGFGFRFLRFSLSRPVFCKENVDRMRPGSIGHVSPMAFLSIGNGPETSRRVVALAAQMVERSTHERTMEGDGARSRGRRGRQAKVEARAASQTAAFAQLGIQEALLRGVRGLGYRQPTPIQRLAIPRALLGDDVVAMARTGSGKTAAFLLPLLQRLMSRPKNGKGTRGIVLSPTRELALQTWQFAKQLAKGNVRCAALVGGQAMEEQFEQLAMDPDLLVVTPGRLLHHLEEVEGMSLRNVECVVFDEADRLFEMGFADDLREILRKMPEERQTMLFSATMPSALAEFTQAGLKEPHLVRLDADTKVSPDLQPHFFVAKQEEKITALVYLLDRVIPADEQTIIFVSTKHHAEFLYLLLQKMGHQVACVYGTMDQMARTIHADKFRMKKAQLLVVTDVAARGIDIPLLDNVINFDFPATPKLFVHRVGRAARAGRKGCAYSLLTREELAYLVDLNLFLGRPLQCISRDAGPEEAKEMQENCIKEKIICYGAFPQSLIDIMHGKVETAIEEDTELTSLTKTISNAFRLYLKTRPPASKESCKRAKNMKDEGVHPLLLKSADPGIVLQEQAKNLVDMKEKIKSYRPAATAFECQIASGRQVGGNVLETDSIMSTKRRIHEGVIDKERNGFGPGMLGGSDVLEEALENAEGNSSKREARIDNDAFKKSTKKTAPVALFEANVDTYKDKEYFISSVPPDLHANRGFAVNPSTSKIRSAVMDLVADEAHDMSKGKRQYHWDKRKKKYVQLQGGEEVRASGKRIITESGAKVSKRKAGPSGIYEAWVKKSKTKVGGEDEDTFRPENLRQQRGHRKGNKMSGSNNARSELKTPEQVRKMRALKEKQLQRNRPKKKGPVQKKKR